MTLACLVFAIGVSVGVLSATPIIYDITFAYPGLGPGETVGSFTYDASLPSDNFSNFVITSPSGLTYDLTSSANAPSVQGICTVSSPQAAFSFLTTSNCGNPLYGGNQWVESVFGSGAELDLYGANPNGSTAIDIGVTIYGSYGAGIDEGIFSVAQVTAPVPEPSSTALSLGGDILVIFVALLWRDSLASKFRRARKQQLP